MYMDGDTFARLCIDSLAMNCLKTQSGMSSTVGLYQMALPLSPHLQVYNKKMLWFLCWQNMHCFRSWFFFPTLCLSLTENIPMHRLSVLSVECLKLGHISLRTVCWCGVDRDHVSKVPVSQEGSCSPGTEGRLTPTPYIFRFDFLQGTIYVSEVSVTLKNLSLCHTKYQFIT
jgi:hypothetical protein